MRSLIASVALVGVLGCGANPHGSPPSYSQNDLELITLFTAKTMCSCLFVMEQTEAYCKVYARQSPAVATYHVDKDKKTVDSSALLMWSAHAHYVDAREGCVLE